MDDSSIFEVTQAKSVPFSQIHRPVIYRSIIDIKPEDLTEKFIFSESASNKAMLKVGATTDDMIKISKLEIMNIPGTPVIRNRIIRELEQRRLKTIQDVIDARNQIVNEMKKVKPKIQKKPANNAKRFDKIKEAQIAELIANQMKIKDVEESETKHSKNVTKKQTKVKYSFGKRRPADAAKSRKIYHKQLRIRDEEQQKLAETIQLKEQKIADNIRTLTDNRKKRYMEQQKLLRQKARLAQERKQKLEEENKQRLMEAIRREEEHLEKIEKSRNNKIKQTKEKSGKDYLKFVNHTKKARELELKKKYEALSKYEKAVQIGETVQQRKLLEKEDKIHNYRRRETQKLKEQDEVIKLKKLIAENPNGLDPQELADEFGVDLVQVQKILAVRNK